MPEGGNSLQCFAFFHRLNSYDATCRRFTCFLDECAVFGGAGILAGTHQVVGEHSEDKLVAHDEVRHHTVGSSILLQDCKPLLCVIRTKILDNNIYAQFTPY